MVSLYIEVSMEKRCICQKTDGSQCTREVSMKPNDNHLFCWQHQKCKNFFEQSKEMAGPKKTPISKKSPTIPKKSPTIPKKSPTIPKKSPIISEKPTTKLSISESKRGDPEPLSLLIKTLPQLLKHYDIVSTIGKGGSAQILMAKDISGQTYAVKVPLITQLGGELYTKNIGTIVHEANVMAELSSVLAKGPFLPFYGLYSYKGLPVLVTKYFNGLKIDYFKTRQDSKYLRLLAKQIYSGLAILHKYGFTHGDLDINNFLVDDNGQLVIIDLSGCSFKKKMVISDMNCKQITSADDLALEEEIWEKIMNEPNLNLLWPTDDIFSMGLTLKDMAFDAPDDFNVFTDPMKLKDSVIEEIIKMSIDDNPKRRPTAEDILKLLSK